MTAEQKAAELYPYNNGEFQAINPFIDFRRSSFIAGAEQCYYQGQEDVLKDLEGVFSKIAATIEDPVAAMVMRVSSEMIAKVPRRKFQGK